MSSSYIVAAGRTPIGKFLGGLSTQSAPQLGATVVARLLKQLALPPAAVDEVIVDEVIFGNVLSAGLGQAPARQVALAAGLPPTVAALTINKMCGSGLKAVMLADQAIRAGDARCVVAGGCESMSRAPYLLVGVREGWKFGPQTTVDHLQHDGLWCAFEKVSMGAEADYTAHTRGVSRGDQDLWSAESHRRALAAQATGSFAAEIVPVEIAGRRGTTTVERDEGPRGDTSVTGLAALRPAFEEQPGIERTVTAGNASQLSDGAAAVVVVDEAYAARCSSPIKARIIASATSGVAPREIFTAPIAAIERVLARAGLTIDDIDLVELNEAFAAQVLACQRPLKITPERLNVHGGAIALGHPIGCSGARVLVTLLHALALRGEKRGLAALCLGGGNAVAMIVERVV